MKHVTYRFETELDFLAVTSSLKESNIPFTSRKYADSSFPFLAQSKAFGDISVASENDAVMKTLIKNLTNTEPTPVDQDHGTPEGKTNKIWRILALVYMIVISLLCFRYWYINYRSMVDKNNTVEWTYDGQDLVLKNKKTGIITSRSTDANYDLNFEEVRYFSDGVNVAECQDKNEDGIYEYMLLFNSKGELIGSNYDLNSDGITDSTTIILENKDTLKLLDTNHNGFLEIIK